MKPALVSFALVLWLAPAAVLALAPLAQDPPKQAQDAPKPDPKKPDTFFAGTVVETTTEKLVVSRVVLGKTEKREFRVTADTKCEGKLKTKVRVTVRYITGEDGIDVADLIIVRTQQQTQKKKQQ